MNLHISFLSKISIITCVLYKSFPLVPSFEFNSASFSRGFAFQSFMGSNVVMEYLITREYWCIFGFESTHSFLSVSDFTVEAFHLIVAHIARA